MHHAGLPALSEYFWRVSKIRTKCIRINRGMGVRISKIAMLNLGISGLQCQLEKL